MTDATNKPVIFLAFANDRDDTVGYLRNLRAVDFVRWGARRISGNVGKYSRFLIADDSQSTRFMALDSFAPSFSAQGITQSLQPATTVSGSLSCARSAPQRRISFFKLNAVQPHSHSC